MVFVFCFVTTISRRFWFPSISKLAIDFPLNFIRLSSTSHCFSFPVDVRVLLNTNFGFSVTVEQLSISTLIGQLLTEALILKNSGLLLFVKRV